MVLVSSSCLGFLLGILGRVQLFCQKAVAGRKCSLNMGVGHAARVRKYEKCVENLIGTGVVCQH